MTISLQVQEHRIAEAYKYLEPVYKELQQLTSFPLEEELRLLLNHPLVKSVDVEKDTTTIITNDLYLYTASKKYRVKMGSFKIIFDPKRNSSYYGCTPLVRNLDTPNMNQQTPHYSASAFEQSYGGACWAGYHPNLSIAIRAFRLIDALEMTLRFIQSYDTYHHQYSQAAYHWFKTYQIEKRTNKGYNKVSVDESFNVLNNLRTV